MIDIILHQAPGPSPISANNKHRNNNTTNPLGTYQMFTFHFVPFNIPWIRYTQIHQSVEEHDGIYQCNVAWPVSASRAPTMQRIRMHSDDVDVATHPSNAGSWLCPCARSKPMCSSGSVVVGGGKLFLESTVPGKNKLRIAKCYMLLVRFLCISII